MEGTGAGTELPALLLLPGLCPAVVLLFSYPMKSHGTKKNPHLIASHVQLLHFLRSHKMQTHLGVNNTAYLLFFLLLV